MIGNKNIAPNAGIDPAKILGGMGNGSQFGRTYYVQSTHTLAVDKAYNPNVPDCPGTHGRPFATIDYAIGQCEDDRGDVILVGPGHAETVSAASGIDADVSGVTIIGCGFGTLRPTITLGTATTATVTVAAANVTFANLIFTSSKTTPFVADVIVVSAADFYCYGCEFKDGGATKLIETNIQLASGADRARIEKCEFYAYSAAGATQAIEITSGLSRVRIIDCVAMGDYSNACIWSNQVHTNAIVRGCLLQNSQTGDLSLEFTAAATGFLYGNAYHNDVAIPGGVDPGSCLSFESYHCHAIDKSGALAPAVDS